jgi:hypothetical protein
MKNSGYLNDKNTFSALELDILKQYYVKLEAIDECTPLIQPDNFDWDNSSQALRLRVSIECNSLTRINQEHIREIFADCSDAVHQYLTERIRAAKNSLLKAKYFHLLYCLTNNNKDINKAIEEYKTALNTCLNRQQDQNRHIKFQEILDVIIYLTKNSKYKIEELKAQIHSYLKAPEIYDRMKTWIIISISKSNLFKVRELDYVPQLCIDLSKKETDHRFIEINLEVGLEISIKLQEIKNQKIINELLGDNEYKQIRSYDGRPESMIVPHYNSSTYKNHSILQECEKCLQTG